MDAPRGGAQTLTVGTRGNGSPGGPCQLTPSSRLAADEAYRSSSTPGTCSEVATRSAPPPSRPSSAT
ncbi:hypothetical protein BJF80_04275 [Serinicoccus sp. CUA-874]|nr:hypothetical protein BJF80_04275 [Serinicoccus sp. CUA-874]